MLKGYEKYKESGIPWDICEPATWDCVRGKALFENPKYINKNNEYKNVLSLTLKGVIRNNIENPNGLVPRSYDTYQLFEKDDLVFKLIDLENISTSRVGIVGEQGIMSPAYIRLVLRKKEKQNIKYYYYQYFSLYQRQIFNSLGAGVRQTLSARELLEQKIMVPPKPEQDKIVQFLDWKISEMNHCIHQKKKQIKLLEELKRNIIDDLITNGKNSEKRVKISKAKWMGNVPYDWNEYRLKNLFQEINVKSELGLEPHLSMSQKKGLVTDDEDIERRLLSESYAGAKLCEKDDLVLNRLKAHLGVFALVPMKGIVSPDYTVLRINAKRVIPKYLEYLLKSNACRRELVTRVRGIVEGFWRLYTEDLGEIPVCIPNTEEQKAILEVILEKTNNIDEMISGINKEIILVEELRTKLISDVVTGQVDVRNVKIPAYETETDIIDSEEDSDEENQEESTE